MSPFPPTKSTKYQPNLSRHPNHLPPPFSVYLFVFDSKHNPLHIVQLTVIPFIEFPLLLFFRLFLPRVSFPQSASSSRFFLFPLFLSRSARTPLSFLLSAESTSGTPSSHPLRSLPLLLLLPLLLPLLPTPGEGRGRGVRS